ncbi:MAG TPA: hypothetical protein ACHBX0_13875 [Arsenophonus sp.]
MTKLGLDKFFNKLNIHALYLSIGIGLFGAINSGLVFSDPPASTGIDYIKLTNSFHFDSVVTGILVVAGRSYCCLCRDSRS